MKTFDALEERNWQQQISDLLDTQADRQIIWIVDKTTFNGQCIICNYLEKALGRFIMYNGSTRDIAYAYEEKPLVIFDYHSVKEDRLNYEVIKRLKDGIIFSSKYQPRMKEFQPPKIVCLNKTYPNVNMMSFDRWMLHVFELYEFQTKEKMFIYLNSVDSYHKIPE